MVVLDERKVPPNKVEFADYFDYVRKTRRILLFGPAASKTPFQKSAEAERIKKDIFSKSVGLMKTIGCYLGHVKKLMQ